MGSPAAAPAALRGHAGVHASVPLKTHETHGTRGRLQNVENEKMETT